MPCSDTLAMERHYQDKWEKRYGSYAHLLCKACAKLSKKERQQIKHPNATHNLDDWYKEHIIDDKG